jgi:hypothetical protein
VWLGFQFLCCSFDGRGDALNQGMGVPPKAFVEYFVCILGVLESDRIVLLHLQTQ